MRIELETDAVPLVRIIGAMARRSLAADAATAKRAAQTSGTVALKSATDPQAVTLRFAGDTLWLERGADPAADVTITADLADDSVKPKVTGAARHPRLALLVGKLLEPPVRRWQLEADGFLDAALADVDCPRPLRVVCTDDGTSRQWGGGGEPTIELHGPADALAAAFSGSSVMAEDVLAGKLQIVGDLRSLSLLTRFSIDHLFGEL